MAGNIKSGDWVLIRRVYDPADERLNQVSNRERVRFGRWNMKLASLIGQPYGATYVFKEDQLIRATPEEIERENRVGDLLQKMTATDGGDDEATDDLERDNRNLIDDQTAQPLTTEDIEILKSLEKAGNSNGIGSNSSSSSTAIGQQDDNPGPGSSNLVIEQLVAHSRTFATKTVYSQAKYLAKKQKKFSKLFVVMRPTVRRLAEFIYTTDPGKCFQMRHDTLAQILEYCNVMSGGRYLVVDTNLGFMSCGILDRCQPTGLVIQVVTKDGHRACFRRFIEALNLPKETLNNCLASITLEELLDIRKESVKNNNIISVEDSEDVQMESDTVPGQTSAIGTPELGPSEKKLAKLDRRRFREAERLRAVDEIGKMDLDGLLIASRDIDPLALLEVLIHFIAPSRPFAVYSPAIEPLVKCFDAIRQHAVYMNLSETWLRKQQILPDRTHPDVNMSQGGGYLLTGIKVDNNNT